MDVDVTPAERVEANKKEKKDRKKGGRLFLGLSRRLGLLLLFLLGLLPVLLLLLVGLR
jgi:hypothetical protein